MIPASPLKLTKKTNKYSILMVIKFKPLVSESSKGSQTFMPTLPLNTNLIKRESKIGSQESFQAILIRNQWL